MLDVGWSELMVIGVTALIVIGPKDLPDMFRTMGRFTAKARSMGRDFQRAMEQAADDAGVKDIAKDLKATTSAKSLGLTAVQDAAKRFESWDPMKTAPVKPVIKPMSSAVASPGVAAADAANAAVVPVVNPAAIGPATAALAEERTIATAQAKALAMEKLAARGGAVAAPAASAVVADVAPARDVVIDATPPRKPVRKLAKPVAVAQSAAAPAVTSSVAKPAPKSRVAKPGGAKAAASPEPAAEKIETAAKPKPVVASETTPAPKHRATAKSKPAPATTKPKSPRKPRTAKASDA